VPQSVHQTLKDFDWENHDFWSHRYWVISVTDELPPHSPQLPRSQTKEGTKTKRSRRLEIFFRDLPPFLGVKVRIRLIPSFITLLFISRLCHAQASYLFFWQSQSFSVSAKRIMGLMSGKSPDSGKISLKLKSKHDKRKHDRPDISSPMDIPAHQVL